MHIVIDVPEELYEAYKSRPPMLGDAGMDMISQSIANGIPLPKGHGRLIDVLDEIKAEIEKLNPVDYGSIYSYESHNGARDMKEDILDIIDKYKVESEDEG